MRGITSYQICDTLVIHTTNRKLNSVSYIFRYRNVYRILNLYNYYRILNLYNYYRNSLSLLGYSSVNYSCCSIRLPRVVSYCTRFALWHQHLLTQNFLINKKQNSSICAMQIIIYIILKDFWSISFVPT